MSRTKKIAVLAIIAMVLTLMPAALFAATADSTRLSGAGRVETALDIASAGTWGSTVILAPADDANLVDALAAAPLAGQENAPILLTFKGSLDAAVKAKIAALGATKVYVVGAISDAVAAEVDAMTGVTVEALKGNGRQATAAAINAKLTSPAGTFVVGYDAVPDALSVASYAAKNKFAIVLASQDGSAAGSSLVGATKYIVGGTAKVDDITGVTRISGTDRFATNSAVASTLTFTYDRVYVANGVSCVDALAVAPLAAKHSAFVALASSSDVAAAATVNAKLLSTSKVIAVGGINAVSDAVKGKVAFGLNTMAISSLTVTGAKKLTVNFTQAVDTAKAVVAVKKGGVTVNIASTTFSTDKTSAVIELSGKITKGDYTVSVTGLTAEAIAKTVTAADEAVAKIDIAANAIYVNATTATAYYHVYNQYNEEITKTASLTSATSASGGVVLTASTGIATFTFAAVKVGDSVTLTLIDTASAVSVAKTLTVSDKAGANDFTIESLYNADGKTLNADSTVGDYKLVIQAKDQYGNKMGAAALAADLLVTVSDTTIASLAGYNPTTNVATFATTKINNVDTVTIALAGALKAGTTKVTLISKTTAKMATFDIVVKDGVQTDAIGLTAPDVLAVGEDAVIQVAATDKNGDAINKVAEFAATTVNVTDTAGASAAVVGAFKLNPTTNKVELVIPTANIGVVKGKATVTVMSETNKVTILQLDVKDKAVPTSFVGFTAKSKVVPNLYINGTIAISTADLIIEDQYGRTLKKSQIDAFLGTDADATVANAGKYIIAFESDNASIVVTDNLTATVTGGGFTTTDAAVNLTAAATKGSATISAKLYVGAAGTGTYGVVAGSGYDYAMGVKDKTQVVSYEVKDPGKIYDDVAAGYTKTLTLYGILSNGTKVEIPNTLYTVSSNNPTVTLAANVVDANATVGADKKDVTVTLSFIVDAHLSTVQLAKDIIVSSAPLTAVELETASAGGLTVNGNGVKGAAADVTVAKLKALVQTVDQYGAKDAGGVGANVCTMTITNITGGTVLTGGTNGTVTPTFVTPPAAGDTFDVTMVYGAKTIVFKVVAQ
ncbi:MAG: cell wall-binding repeat-containing protein [Dehalobacter sp. 4CP]|uniref:cell wall-binding repeat-containing protein n=1 Tax=unclassified Dehalobacter TaxID=2635733 RepID=UPI0013C5C0BC|nr:cell wall-binding repeat-containing protein [Dehalobacter sp.]MDJ0305577.1 cell wall-binding repeat-containing protein [Dehalobacter sp.]NBJ15093.1 cell wall-binding repeat-containing protein [Dehalobacter sp. 4CP]